MAAKVAFLLLTRNEEKSISQVIEDVRKQAGRLALENCQIALADDSEDDTRRIATRLGAVVFAGDGRGLGSAYRIGIKGCVELGADLIVSLDADGQTDLSELGRFLDELRKGADLVLGSRFQPGARVDYRYPIVNRIGVWLLSSYISLMTGQKITDSHGGLRAMTAEVARSLEMLGTFTYVQETIVDASEKSFKIVEIPVSWKPRVHGTSRVVGSISRYVRYTLPVLMARALPRLSGKGPRR